MPQWLDVNSAFGLNGRSELLPDTGAIDNSLYNLLTCPIGTRAWQPAYGSQLPRLIYDPVDTITANKIRMSIFSAIDRWEPRISLVRSGCSVTPLTGQAGYSVVLTYTVKSTGAVSKANFIFIQ